MEFIARVETARPVQVPGTAVFMTAQPTGLLPAPVHTASGDTIIVTRREGMAVWPEKLRVSMARNAVRATTHADVARCGAWQSTI